LRITKEVVVSWEMDGKSLVSPKKEFRGGHTE
jgi:hypothetical protein